MIRLIEALNYRCLRYVRQEMGPFHVLVGPNASGKSTFLDVIAFLGDLVSKGPEEAIRSRSPNPRDLVWNHDGDRFELAIELAIPEELREQLEKPFDTVRYEVAVGPVLKTEQIGIVAEKVLLRCRNDYDEKEHLIPRRKNECDSILTCNSSKNKSFILLRGEDSCTLYHEFVPKENKKRDVDYSFLPSPYRELAPEENKYYVDFVISPSPFSSSLQNTAITTAVSEHNSFPISNWLIHFLTANIQFLSLDSHSLRKPSPPGQGVAFKPDGSNMPLVIEKFKEQHNARFRDWIAHLRTALPDLEDIEVIDRPEDRHRWLRLCYRGDLKVPSWMVSDGTLRLLALTILAYLPDLQGVFLIEEPENGIHPRAIETMVQSLRSVYGAQVLLATHSPIVLGVAELDEVLCFDKAQDGSTNIVLGSEHPALRDWQHDTDLGSLFAAGVLG